MLYREIIAVCSEIHTTRTNTLCGQNLELLSVNLVAHTGFRGLVRWLYVKYLLIPAFSNLCRQIILFAFSVMPYASKNLNSRFTK